MTLQDLQRIPTHFLTEGVVQSVSGQLAVTERSAGANMSVDVAAGLCLIEITTTLLATNYTVKTWLQSTATVNVTVPTADPTNPRIDRIIAKYDPTTDPDGSLGNNVSVELVQGTPASSPSAPATPSNAISLATISVPASDTTISNAQITDDRSYVQLDSTVLQDIARKADVDSDVSDLQEDAVTWLGTITGTDTLTGSASPTRTAYAAGQRFAFIVASDNTGAVTLNIDSLGAKSLKDSEGNALNAADLKTGGIVECRYDGTDFLLTSQKHSSVDQGVTILHKTTSDSSDVTSGTYASYDQTYDIAAGSLAVGDIIEVFASVTGSSYVGDIKARLGGQDIVEKTNTTIDGDPRIHWIGTVRSIGASGTIEITGRISDEGSFVAHARVQLTVDTTGALTIDFQTAKDSGAGVTNHLSQFIVRKYKA
ncbi:hypothetical protein [Symmachiella dynata]|uniref:hypothetical protein n=1 Tax=Symmachiella dynata TaxID=2527995 RepID=UPI00119F7063|nr:hypothetical protein [Symmachiella dynata]